MKAPLALREDSEACIDSFGRCSQMHGVVPRPILSGDCKLTPKPILSRNLPALKMASQIFLIYMMRLPKSKRFDSEDSVNYVKWNKSKWIYVRNKNSSPMKNIYGTFLQFILQSISNSATSMLLRYLYGLRVSSRSYYYPRQHYRTADTSLCRWIVCHLHDVAISTQFNRLRKTTLSTYLQQRRNPVPSYFRICPR